MFLLVGSVFNKTRFSPSSGDELNLSLNFSKADNIKAT